MNSHYKLFFGFTLIKIIYIYLVDAIAEDEDQSTKLSINANSFDLAILKPFFRFDSLMFVNIANDGYLYEKNSAFFPFYSIISKGVDSGLKVLGLDIHIGYSFLLITFVFQILSIKQFSILAKLVLKNQRLCDITLNLYILSPATVFFSAAYSESLFMFLCLAALTQIYLLVENGFKFLNGQLAILFIFAAGLTRSTSMFYIPTLAYLMGVRFLNNTKIRVFITSCLIIGIGAIIFAVPYFLVLYYNYKIYCGRDGQPSWCEDERPNIYSSIQGRFWMVGFFKGFYMLSPDTTVWALLNLSMVICALRLLFESHWTSFLQLRRLAMWTDKWPKVSNILSKPICHESHSISLPSDFEFSLLFSFLLLTCISTLYAYLPSSTRFMAVHPSYYFILARLWEQGTEKTREFMIFVISIHIIVGCSFFSNYYLWV